MFQHDPGIGGKLYLAGGAPRAGGVSGRLDVYNPSTDSWTRKADMLAPAVMAGSAAVHGLLYGIGGLATSEPP